MQSTVDIATVIVAAAAAHVVADDVDDVAAHVVVADDVDDVAADYEVDAVALPPPYHSLEDEVEFYKIRNQNIINK